MATAIDPAAKQEFVITRVFDAPRELMWKALTERDRLVQWWGPKGFTVNIDKLELRPGGTFSYSMTMPNGPTMWGKWVFRELTPPEKLVFVVSFTDEEGTPVRHPMSPTWPLETLSTMELHHQAGKTLLVSRAIPINATDEEHKTFEDGFESMKQGWGGTWDQLADYLATARA